MVLLIQLFKQIHKYRSIPKRFDATLLLFKDFWLIRLASLWEGGMVPLIHRLKILCGMGVWQHYWNVEITKQHGYFLIIRTISIIISICSCVYDAICRLRASLLINLKCLKIMDSTITVFNLESPSSLLILNLW